jgi:hypothetical protein
MADQKVSIVDVENTQEFNRDLVDLEHKKMMDDINEYQQLDNPSRNTQPLPLSLEPTNDDFFGKPELSEHELEKVRLAQFTGLKMSIMNKYQSKKMQGI